MRNLALLISSVFFCTNTMGQCALSMDSTGITDPHYMPLDTLMLKGDKFILIQEIVFSETTYYKFELKGDSVKITRKNNLGTSNLYIHDFFEVFDFQPGQLSVYSDFHSQHRFNMVYIKSNLGLFVIIPVGSIIEEANKCIFSAMPELSIQIEKLIKWREKIDSLN